NNILRNYPEIDISIIKEDENEKPIFDYNNYKIKYYYFNKLDSYNFKHKFDFYFLDDILAPAHKIRDTTNFFNYLYPNKILENSKRIVCIGHDLIPLLFHEYYLNPKSVYFLHLETAKIIEHFFVNSENTKNDFIEYLNIDKNKLTVIYSGVDKKFENPLKEYYHKERLNNIIFVSGEDRRKNAQGLIRAFAIAYNSKNIPIDSKLYICCKAGAGYSNFLKSTMRKCNIKNRVIITGFISDEDMINLISNSKASFFPSFYEGLGLPILESYACSTPSFASNVSSTKEFVLKECSFDPYDDNDMANAIIKAFNDEELCKKSVEFGRKLLKEKCNGDVVSKKVVEKLKELNKTVIMDKAIFMEYNDYKLFSYTNSHIFLTIHHYSDMETVNNSLDSEKYNNDFIPIEYYNNFLNKYKYNKKIFVLGSSKILEYAVKETDKNNSYLFIYKSEIFNIIFDYLNNSLDNFKEIIKKYYYNLYKIIECIDNINDI
ncbi:glycosyltransferase family 4 protein, partial [Brachyspira sp.]|uniref:glycosyltransferase family 4 protein n=1 Tax=Brachyspira sp. TaxID=1977261 RepID=UPI003D7D8C20